MSRPAGFALSAVLAWGLACGLDGEWIDLSVAASTESAVSEVVRSHPNLMRSTVPVVTQANASSTLARQLLDGAPADVFLSADAAWADAITASRPVLARVELLHNRLVEVSNDDGIRRCTALADPDHVPAGRYAKQGLEAAGRWPPADPVPFPTGPAAAFAVANGDCAAGFVYATDAAAAGLVPVGALEVRATYPLLLLEERGRPLFDALQSEHARAVFVEHGFEVPR